MDEALTRLEKAKRESDWNLAGEIQHGVVPDLERRLELHREAAKLGKGDEAPMLSEEVTEESIAQVRQPLMITCSLVRIQGIDHEADIFCDGGGVEGGGCRNSAASQCRDSQLFLTIYGPPDHSGGVAAVRRPHPKTDAGGKGEAVEYGR